MRLLLVLVFMVNCAGCESAASHENTLTIVFIHFPGVDVSLEANGCVLFDGKLDDRDPSSGVSHVLTVQLSGAVDFVLRHSERVYSESIDIADDVLVLYVDSSEDPFLVQRGTSEILTD